MPEIMVTIGHRQRPLRDGGGKPSPGRTPPSLRTPNIISPLGQHILEASNYNSHHDHELAAAADAMSYNTTGDTPIPTKYTTRVREAICNYTGTTADITDGQPFLLHTMAALAKMAEDPDWDYPNLVEHGVNLGVDEDIDPSPDVWPSKEEMTDRA